MRFHKTPLTILAVDDAAPMRKMLKDNLRVMGVSDVLLAENGEDALSQLEEAPVDLIISDWSMPKMDGIQLLRHVRQSAKFHAIPFMMLTAATDRAAVNEAIEAGVTQFLVKPFTYAELQSRVGRILTRVSEQAGGEIAPVLPFRPDRDEPVIEQPENATVLVVDDAPANIDVIAGILKRTYRVKAATSGEKALEIAEREPQPDLILLDIMMPGMDGYEVCRLLKENPHTAGLPVIFLTAKSESNDVTRGFKTGGVDYIVKPADPAILEARVATHIRIKRSRDDLQNHLDSLLAHARLREDVERITRHDLKSPLTAVITTADALLQKAWLPEHMKKNLETIRFSGYDALGMVNRTLDIYKLETNSYEMRPIPIDIVDIVNQVVREVSTYAFAGGVEIAVRSPNTCYCYGEEALCMSILRNLIKNAVEASPRNEVVNVVVAEKQQVSIMIRNRGTVPAAIQDRFFEKYVTSGRAHGSGLGTYTAKLMTEAQHGKIRMLSDDEKGTVLHIQLPKAKP